jgi:hypothetical protein
VGRIDSLQIGPLFLRLDQLTIIASAVVFYIALSRTVQSTVYTRLVDHAMAALLIFIVSWKLSLLISDPTLVVRAPSIMLLMPGTRTGFILGMTAAIIYLLYRINREQWSLLTIGGVIALPSSIGMVIYYSLKVLYGQPAHGYTALLLLPVVWLLWRLRVSQVYSQHVSVLWIGFGMARLIASLFEMPGTLTAGLTTIQWVCIAAALLGIAVRRLTVQASNKNS